MSGTVIKKENITISIGTYEKEGQQKQRYKTIGELVTMRGDDGSTYQFGEMWGPTGSTKFNVYEQQDRNAQTPAPQQAPAPYQNPQAIQQAPQAQHNPNPPADWTRFPNNGTTY